jgi:hypothetical protein
MTDREQVDSILAFALRMFLAKRCERAYLHDFRNSMQGVYVGMDVIARLLSGKAGAVSSDRALQIARRAIQSHEQTLAHTLQHLVGKQETPCAIDVGPVLQEIATFLNNDASVRGVSIRLTASTEVQLEARPENLRSVLLSVTTKAVDAMSDGGEINVAAHSVGAVVTITFSLSPTSALSDISQWRFADDINPLSGNWTLYATRRLVLDDGGEIESGIETRDTHPCHVLRLRYQAAKSSPLVIERPGELPSA